ncbi:MAG: hypothetical protein JWP87_3388 [Labilithrix sp.]|nr:hypothetical protein [Labilithrix sp.]
MRSTLVIAVALAFVALACGAFSSSEQGPGTEADGGDAASSDAPSTQDAPSTGDAATDAGCAISTIPPGVACGVASCAPPSFCCTPGGCTEAGGACAGFAVYCDDTADCAAAGKTCQVCCATTQNDAVTASFCAPSCKATERQLCNPGANDCTDGKTCRASTLDHDACE